MNIILEVPSAPDCADGFVKVNLKLEYNNELMAIRLRNVISTLQCVDQLYVILDPSVNAIVTRLSAQTTIISLLHDLKKAGVTDFTIHRPGATDMSETVGAMLEQSRRKIHRPKF